MSNWAEGEIDLEKLDLVNLDCDNIDLDSILIKKSSKKAERQAKNQNHLDGETQRLYEELLACGSIDKLKKEILPKLQHQRAMWIEKINEIVWQSAKSKKEFAALCGVSRQSLDKWLKGSIPQKRNEFIRIGFAAGYDLEQMNFFLKRYGRLPELYPKRSLEDSVFIFVLTSETLEHSYENCQKILMDLSKSIEEEKVVSKEEKFSQDIYATEDIIRDLTRAQSEDELQHFIGKMLRDYKKMYNKFYSYVKVFVMINCGQELGDLAMNPYDMICDWPSSMQQYFRATLQRKWIPMRTQVIRMGLFLNMDLSQINEMLTYAKMEPLYARNPLESVIIYALKEAKHRDVIMRDGGTDLYDYVSKILNQVNLDWIMV